MNPSRFIIPVLSLTLLISWGSLYYSFAMFAPAIQAQMHWSATSVMGAYSMAVLVWGLCAYGVGRYIDRYGGQRVMTLGSSLCSVLFFALSATHSQWVFYLIWGGLGAGMALTLYEPAFAVLVEIWPNNYRQKMGILTLAGGLASTVFWPLTQWLITTFGWRDAALIYAAIHSFICAPLHWFILPKSHQKSFTSRTEIPNRSSPRPLAFWLLAITFASFGFVTAAIATHVVPIIESRGVAPFAALTVVMFIGPMQVASRSVELLLARRLSPFKIGVLAVSLITAGIFTLWGASQAYFLYYVFVLLYGFGLGLLTIVRATTPAVIFGIAGYATTNGALSAPSVLARAAGPIACTFLVSRDLSYDTTLLALLACASIGVVTYLLAIRKKVP
jgi:MFS family permease